MITSTQDGIDRPVPVLDTETSVGWDGQYLYVRSAEQSVDKSVAAVECGSRVSWARDYSNGSVSHVEKMFGNKCATSSIIGGVGGTAIGPAHGEDEWCSAGCQSIRNVDADLGIAQDESVDLSTQKSVDRIRTDSRVTVGSYDSG
nr:hypothetical protein [Rhodococcus sp. 15-1154-1]